MLRGGVLVVEARIDGVLHASAVARPVADHHEVEVLVLDVVLVPDVLTCGKTAPRFADVLQSCHGLDARKSSSDSTSEVPLCVDAFAIVVAADTFVQIGFHVVRKTILSPVVEPCRYLWILDVVALDLATILYLLGKELVSGAVQDGYLLFYERRE